MARALCLALALGILVLGSGCVAVSAKNNKLVCDREAVVVDGDAVEALDRGGRVVRPGPEHDRDADGSGRVETPGLGGDGRSAVEVEGRLRASETATRAGSEQQSHPGGTGVGHAVRDLSGRGRAGATWAPRP